MFNYQWIKLKYIRNKEEEDKFDELIITYWQYVLKTNYSVNNFLFNNFSLLNIYGKQSSFFTTSPLLTNLDNIESEDDVNRIQLSINSTPLINDNVMGNFFYLRKLTFINFFLNNMIDVPICFKKSKSLKLKNFELPVLKFSNFLMKEGKREKILKILFKTIGDLHIHYKKEQIISDVDQNNWAQLYFFFGNVFWNRLFKNTRQSFYNIENNIFTDYNNLVTSEEKSINSDFFVKSYLLSRLSKVLPVFSYFIYSVDKNIRKFSRGKSGKYTFIWKYVAPYKRLFLAMRLIVKDIKFFSGKSISERILKTLISLTDSPEKSLIWKSKIFSHNHVFKNFRKTLMSSLRTTS